MKNTPLYEKYCEHCKEIFVTHKDLQKYCTIKCNVAFHNSLYYEKNKQNILAKAKARNETQAKL